MPVIRCASASSHPNKTIQMTLPMIEGAPALGRRTILRPNGQSAKAAILKHANPKGDRDDQDEGQDPEERIKERQPKSSQHEPNHIQD
jgi:hypothetical protein